MRKRGRGFTLAEIMLTLGLVALVYTMISTILIQISRYVRDGREIARERYELLNAVEELRYQLRSLYFPGASPGLAGARTQTEGQDSLRFLTTNGRTHDGVVEAGYFIQPRTTTDVDEVGEKEAAPALYYREFRFRRREFRTLDVHSEAPWKVMLKNMGTFEVSYSSGGATWQREWENPEPPGRIRIRMARAVKSHDKIVFDVIPGIGARRW
ncbi:MAG: type II secretion system protein [Candidatus Eremiobacteraeota bacterium]|nr:type II secretion system protein [Candidatus Eremiobacteraeota bacterium]